VQCSVFRSSSRCRIASRFDEFFGNLYHLNAEEEPERPYMDPYERADVVSDQYDDWRVENGYLHAWLTFHAVNFLETFVEYPPSQPPASFTIDQVEADVERRIREKTGR